jgi:hypothetical protein
MTTTIPRFATADQRRNHVLTTVMDLLDALRTHLAAFELPELYSVTVITARGERRVNVHLTCDHLPDIASGLLAWADTLTKTTAEAWRVPDGHSIHLSVTGQLPNGTPVHVYSGIAFTKHGIGANLAPDTSTTLPLTALREWAAPGEVTP